MRCTRLGIRKRSLIPFLLLLLLFSYQCYKKPTEDSHQELVNGDFSLEITVGWQKRVVNHTGDYEIKRIREGDEYYGKVSKSFCGYAQLYQIVKIQDLSSSISFRARFFAITNNDEYAAASGVLIEYLNAELEKLGATYFYSKTPNFREWRSSSTTHLYETNSSNWQSFSFNIKEELTNYLTGIQGREVKYLKISLLAYCTQESGC